MYKLAKGYHRFGGIGQTLTICHTINNNYSLKQNKDNFEIVAITGP